MAVIDLENISYAFRQEEPLRGFVPGKGGADAGRFAGFSLKNINLRIADGKSTVVLGPSGCGKTTLLKIIAGLIKHDSGTIYFNREPMDKVRPGGRRIGMVFQDYALYPHYDAETNITSFFLFRRKTKEMEVKRRELFERTSALLDVDIRHLLRRRPPTLSGGEKQRVAVGRCITREPRLFLLDEPFSNLDRSLREKYRLSLKKLLTHFSITTVYVTHDQQEAAVLADELVVMNEGRIEQAGPVREVFDHPRNKFVAGFLSVSSETVPINFLDGELLSRDLAGTVVGVRPEDIRLASEKNADVRNAIVTEVRPIIVKDRYILCADYRESLLQANLPLGAAPAKGDTVHLSFNKYFVFDHITEKLVRQVTKGAGA